jgi:hypothetical protein
MDPVIISICAAAFILGGAARVIHTNPSLRAMVYRGLCARAGISDKPVSGGLSANVADMRGSGKPIQVGISGRGVSDKPIPPKSEVLTSSKLPMGVVMRLPDMRGGISQWCEKDIPPEAVSTAKAFFEMGNMLLSVDLLKIFGRDFYPAANVKKGATVPLSLWENLFQFCKNHNVVTCYDLAYVLTETRRYALEREANFTKCYGGSVTHHSEYAFMSQCMNAFFLAADVAGFKERLAKYISYKEFKLTLNPWAEGPGAHMAIALHTCPWTIF